VPDHARRAGAGVQQAVDVAAGLDVHRDQAEDRVRVEPQPQVEDEEDADDRVEEGEDGY
jgi:hypothetical protein